MRHAFAVDLGGTELRAAIVSETGELRGLATTATDAAGGPDAVIEQVVTLLRRVVEGAGPLDVEGLGMAAPGPLDPVAGIALAPPTLQGWREVPLAALLSKRLGMPVRLENDANAAALGEWRFGAGQGTASMVFVTVSTGIGGGVIADGRLLHGRRGMAGEIGHMTVAYGSDDALFCGAPGAWEALASGTALGREATRRMAGADGAQLRALAGAGSVTARHVVAAARMGDPLACGLLRREAELLGVGFVNLLHLYAPERIVVGGGLGTALDLMQGDIDHVIQTRALAPYRDTPVVAAALAAAAGLTGVASLILTP